METNFEKLDPIGIDPNDIDINFVLVHGLNGDGTAFINLNTGKSMMSCLRSSFPRSRIIKYVYPNNSIGMMTNKQPLPLKERGLNFVQGLATVLHDKAPIIFIGHSMGGLVIKQALITAKQTQKLRYIWDQVRGVAFYGTPHTGSSLANLLSFLRLHTIAIDELTENNEYLLSLKRDFNQIVTEKKMKILSIVEAQKCGALNKKIVEYGSAVCGLGDQYEESYKLDWDHTEIQRPSSLQDVRYKHLYYFITKTALNTMTMKNSIGKPHTENDDNDDQKEGLMENEQIVCIDPKDDKSDDMSIALRQFEHRQDLEGFTGLMAAVLANESKSFKRQEIENAFKDDVLKQNRKILNELMQTKELIDVIDQSKIKESIELSMRYWNLLKKSKSVIKGKKDQVNQLLAVFNKFQQILEKGAALKPGEKLSNNQVKFVSYVGEEIKEWFEDNPEISQLNDKWTALHQELNTIKSFWQLTQTKIKEIIGKSVEKTKEKLKEASSKVKKTCGIFGTLAVCAAVVCALVASPIAIAVAAVVGTVSVAVGAYRAYHEIKELKRRKKEVEEAEKRVAQITKETKRIVEQFETMTTDAAKLDALFDELVDNMKTPKKPAKNINRFSDFEDDEEPNYEILVVNAGIVIDSLKDLQITCQEILNTIAEAQDNFYK